MNAHPNYLCFQSCLAPYAAYSRRSTSAINPCSHHGNMDGFCGEAITRYHESTQQKEMGHKGGER